MACREHVETYLREQGVDFAVRTHRPAYTAQEISATEHIPGKMVAKVVLVRADGQVVMLVLPASYQVDFARARKALGVQHLRLLDEPELAILFPDCDVGAEPPFGNLYGLPVYVDRHLADDEIIVFPIGTHTETMTLGFGAFTRLVSPTIAAFAEPKAAYVS
jgi:Ala-tRNA(Pro) deacylase